MDNNVFAKNKKYNPDVISNHEKKRNERDKIEYQHSEKFFNLNNQSNESLSKQLSNNNNYNIDAPIPNFESEIEKKMNERKNQEFDFKGNNKNVIPSSNPNEFHQFNDLKNDKERQQNKNNEKKKLSEHEQMMNDLKNLGIIN